MTYNLEEIKGIHPGKIVERELKKRNLGKGKFALLLNEYPQTFGAILLGNRKMNLSLALKIENELGFEEGFLMLLQVYFDIEKFKNQNKLTPDLSKIRPALFWDTDISKIDWIKRKNSVLERVFERGNEVEKEEIDRFYNLTKFE